MTEPEVSDSVADENSDASPPRKRTYPRRERRRRINGKYRKPENPYFFPAWNPTNDPDNVNCRVVMTQMISCRYRNVFPSQKYRDGMRDDCRIYSDDMWLCNRLRWVERDEALEMLEEAYPWVADKTQGFRFRHVWRFRDRPPKPFDDPSMSTEEYAILRESPRVWYTGGRIINAFTRMLAGDDKHDRLFLPAREYYDFLENKQNEYMSKKKLEQEAAEPTAEDAAAFDAIKREAGSVDPDALGTSSLRPDESRELQSGIDEESLRALANASDSDVDATRELARAQRELFGSETALQEESDSWETPPRASAAADAATNATTQKSSPASASSSSSLKKFFGGFASRPSDSDAAAPTRKPSEPRTLGESLSVWGRTLLKPVGEEKAIEDERWKLNLDLEKKSGHQAAASHAEPKTAEED